jgi:hypothetical protein
MSAYSTVHVSRDVAIKSILSSLNNATNDELGDALDGLFGEKHVCNFQVHASGNEEDNNYLESIADPYWS